MFEPHFLKGVWRYLNVDGHEHITSCLFLLLKNNIPLEDRNRKNKMGNKLYLTISFCLILFVSCSGYKEIEFKEESNGFKWYRTENYFHKYGAESVEGRTIIPNSRGYTFIMFHPVEGHIGYFHVFKWRKEGVCDINGREIIAPSRKNQYLFFHEGRFMNVDEAVDYTLDSNGNVVRIASSESSNAMDSFNEGHILLHKGSYLICGINGDVDGIITIYTDYLDLHGLSQLPLKEVQENGTRIYDAGNGVVFVVDGNYNIRRENSVFDCSFKKKGSDGRYNGNYNIVSDGEDFSQKKLGAEEKPPKTEPIERGMLYRGDYTITSEFGDSYLTTISIYENYLYDGMTQYSYKSTNSSGWRMYSGNGAFGQYNVFYVNTETFDIRLVTETTSQWGSSTSTSTVTKGASRMLVPQNGNTPVGGNSDYQWQEHGRTENPVQPHQETKDCSLCHGSGKCSTCNGKHTYYNGLTGKYLECPNCKPNGACSSCGGSGKKTSTKYY